MSDYEDFKRVRFLAECSCGHTIDAQIVGEETAETIEAAWEDDHPEGGYVGGAFHGPMRPPKKAK